MLKLYKEIGESINKRRKILELNILYNKMKEYHLLIPIEFQNHLINLPQEPFMRENGRELQEMVMESKSGQMVQCMRVIGVITRLMGRENLLMQMVMYSMDIGKEIRRMDMVFINMLMEADMKENGEMTYNMVMELKYVIHLNKYLKGQDGSKYVGYYHDGKK